MGRIGNQQAVDALIQALKDEDKKVRYCAALALGRIGNQQAVETLIQALKDKDKIITRKRVAEALCKIDSCQAVEPLIQALKDKDRNVRYHAAEALGKIGILETLEKLIKSPEIDIHDSVIFSLARTLAVRFSKEKAPFIPVYPELIKYCDFAVLDKEDFPVLVAKVIKVRLFDEDTGFFYYQEANKYAKRVGAEYVLIVTPSKMKLWRLSNGEVLAEFDTATALRPYINKEFTVEKSSKDYIKGLVMLWLDDLIYSWKEAEAPYKKELKSLGILERLEYVELETEVWI